MTVGNSLTPAGELAARNTTRYPNESPEYRRARQALLVEEIELRRHLERVAEQRRALPPGGEVTKSYRFQSESGPVSFVDLFGEKQTLLVYSYMFGPQRARPCPMCTSLLSAWDGEARDVEQRVALAVIARSPIEKLVAFKKERGWRYLKLYSDTSGDFSRDYRAITPDGGDDAHLNVFTRVTERSVTSGVARWEPSPPIQDKTRVARRISCFYGRCWTSRRRDAGRTGIRNSTTAHNERR